MQISRQGVLSVVSQSQNTDIASCGGAPARCAATCPEQHVVGTCSEATGAVRMDTRVPHLLAMQSQPAALRQTLGTSG